MVGNDIVVKSDVFFCEQKLLPHLCTARKKLISVHWIYIYWIISLFFFNIKLIIYSICSKQKMVFITLLSCSVWPVTKIKFEPYGNIHLCIYIYTHVCTVTGKFEGSSYHAINWGSNEKIPPSCSPDNESDGEGLGDIRTRRKLYISVRGFFAVWHFAVRKKFSLG